MSIYTYASIFYFDMNHQLVMENNEDQHHYPEDILSLVLEKLTLEDHRPFGSVCKQWKSLAIQYENSKYPKGIPGLIIPGSIRSIASQNRRFLAFPVGKNIDREQDLPVLSIPHRSLCRGSHLGWLVMAENDMNMYLLNPITGVRIDLPHITTLPYPRRGLSPLMSKWYVKKAFLSRSPCSSASSSSSDCFVVVVFGYGELAFCRVGDRAWKLLEGMAWGDYVDAIFHKDQLYTVDCVGDVYTCDLTADPHPRFEKIWVLQPPVCHFVQNWYIAELGGELLQVRRLHHICGGDGHDTDSENGDWEEEDDDDDNGQAAAAIDSESDAEFDENNRYVNLERAIDHYDYDNYFRPYNFNHIAIGFEIYKLDRSGSYPAWIPTNDLNGASLFIGINQSLLLSNQELMIMGYKENRIYYTDDYVGFEKLYEYSGYDNGIFNLGDSTFEPLYATDVRSTKPPAIWFTPY